MTIGHDWTVVFEDKLDAPRSASFPDLIDWAKHTEEAIRHFSGKATYRLTFDAPGQADAISLGTVANIASVRLNGRDLGVLWSAPWRVALQKGLLLPTQNVLEVTVANLWANRLIGDSALSPEQRKTKTTWSPFRPDSPLQPSGLLGPVTLMRRARP